MCMMMKGFQGLGCDVTIITECASVLMMES